MWAVRCVHESQMHNENSMVTLTYDDEHLPKNSSLDYSHFKLFIRSITRSLKKPIRYFGAGEYGDKGERPHLHVLLFGHTFPDQKLLYANNQLQTFTSDQLTRFWARGFATTQPVNYGTASYVSRYCLKKATSKIAYGNRLPEKAFMSRKPGIGSSWYDKYKNDLYAEDRAISGQFKAKVPRYYDNKLEKEDPRRFKKIKIKRFQKSLDIADDDSRRGVKETIAIEKASQSKRQYEET